MDILQHEELISISEASKYIKRVYGWAVDPQVVYRLIRRKKEGRNDYLGSVRIGGRVKTSEGAIDRFMVQENSPDAAHADVESATNSSDGAPSRSHDRAMHELQKLGVV